MHEYRRFIQAQLDERGWRPADLARKSGLSKQLISDVLKDDRDHLGRMPNPSTISALARGFGIAEETVRAAAARSLVDYSDDGTALTITLGEVSTDALLNEIRRRIDHADLSLATAAPATAEDTQDQASAREKTAAQLQADLDALTNGDIPVVNEDRTALVAKLRAGIDALQEQAQVAQVHDLADRRRKAHELRGTQDPFDDPNPEGAEWPDGTVVGRDETNGYLQWIASGKPADFARFKEGRQSDHDLAARENDERKGSGDTGLDDGEE